MNAFEPRSPMYEGNELTAVPKSTFFFYFGQRQSDPPPT